MTPLRFIASFLVAGALAFAACGHSPDGRWGGESPGGWLEKPNPTGPAVPRASTGDLPPVKGAFVAVVLKSGRTLRGELLAADGQSLWLEMGHRVHQLAVKDVQAVQTGAEERAMAFGAWTCAGALSTLSHGVCLIVSLPVWLIVGGTTTALNAFGDNEHNIEPSRVDALRQYTRFPQGLPEHWSERGATAKTASDEGPTPLLLDAGPQDGGSPETVPVDALADAGPADVLIDAGAAESGSIVIDAGPQP